MSSSRAEIMNVTRSQASSAGSRLHVTLRCLISDIESGCRGPTVGFRFDASPSTLLPRTLGEPAIDHREPIAAPERLAIDEDPGRTEYAAGHRRFAVLACDQLDLGVDHSR